jgi:hypothetical protein
MDNSFSLKARGSYAALFSPRASLGSLLPVDLILLAILTDFENLHIEHGTLAVYWPL